MANSFRRNQIWNFDKNKDIKRTPTGKISKLKKYSNLLEDKSDIQLQKELEAEKLICTFYLEGKCLKGNNCTFSHFVSVPQKMELCKFYVNSVCEKGNNCLYLHSEYPCSFYHTPGKVCIKKDHCKFAHGEPLSEVYRQMFFGNKSAAENQETFPDLTLDKVAEMLNANEKPDEVKEPFGFYGPAI